MSAGVLIVDVSMFPEVTGELGALTSVIIRNL